ncbi:hypothetical protein [Shewanella sp. Isolate11]|uniref:hypothetical protein n=1 Tax=Shewanella sp. Isolate11 TaxID=2908530 RepID=UPI001EFD9BA8|nr:hypothetical protein [Shewanella sp. Isolate11]MCG9698154.1 hypothetical protein [Shewanella sp. Isolate11]
MKKWTLMLLSIFAITILISVYTNQVDNGDKEFNYNSNGTDGVTPNGSSELIKPQNKNNYNDSRDIQHVVIPPQDSLINKSQVDDILEAKKSEVVIKSDFFEEMGAEDMNLLIDTVKYSTQKNEYSYETEEKINNELSNLNLDNISLGSAVEANCDMQVCIINFLSDDKVSAINTLEYLSNNKKIGNHLRGGILKVFEEDGAFHGLMYAVVGEHGGTVKIN